MKSRTVLWLAALIVALTFSSDAQVLQTIYSFTNPNGASPLGALTLGADGNVYGVTSAGGSYLHGTIFKVDPSGMVTTVFSFNGTNGANPAGALTLGADGNLYGTTIGGGIPSTQFPDGMGTVFRFDTNSTLTTLVSFNQNNGAIPRAPLVLGPDGTLYGTTAFGGFTNAVSLPFGLGTVFSITTNGVLTTLAQFANTNGYEPAAGLTFGSDGRLYGMTLGGTNYTAPGTFFVVGTNGGLQMLTVFTGPFYSTPFSLALGGDGNLYGLTLTNLFRIDSSGAITALTAFNSSNKLTSLSPAPDGNFFGVASNGIFLVSTNGVITNLVTLDNSIGQSINPVTLSPDGHLYGTAGSGGSGSAGTVFRASTNGDLQLLYSFDGRNGANPRAGLALGPDNNFYGSTYGGGFGYGTVFKITRDGQQSTIALFDNSTHGGANPVSALTLAADGKFYGTTPAGGLPGGYPCYSDSQGTIYSVTTNGVLTTLFSFNDSTNGASPQSSLTLGSDGFLYGTTKYAGMGVTCPGQLTGLGTIFTISTNGSFSQLSSLNGSGFQFPLSPLIEGPDGSFYGMAGPFNGGNLFRMRTNFALTSLATFKFTNGVASANKLVFANDGYLYGTSQGGISNSAFSGGMGVVFRAATNGNITRLFQFNRTNNAITPSGGLYPRADGWFYGLTIYGGATNVANRDGFGTAYRINAAGQFETLAVFGGTNGSFPVGDLIPGGDGYLYGATISGGAGGLGTVFRLLLQPQFISQSQGQTNVIGTSITLSSEATNLVGAGYQWQINGTNIAGATNAAYAIPSATLNDSGIYTVIISNAAGATASSNIPVRIVPPGTLTLNFSAGRPNLNLFGLLSSNYTVQYTTNLMGGDWVDLLIVTNLSGNPNPFIDSNSIPGPGGRFYRAIIP